MPRHGQKYGYQPRKLAYHDVYGDHYQFDATIERVRLPRTTNPMLLRLADQSHGTGAKIVWTKYRQATACDRGFFFHRTAPDNHVTVIPVGSRFTDAHGILAYIQGRAFHHERWAMIALAFIRQQDTVGYRYAWDREVRNYTPNLRWYKALRHKRETRERDKPMPYALIGREIPHVESYAEAVAAWERAKRWRSQSYTHNIKHGSPGRGGGVWSETTGDTLHPNERRMGESTKRYHGIIKYDDGCVALRYHDTNVVTWRPDDTFVVTGYESRSTTAFADAATPRGVSFNMTAFANMGETTFIVRLAGNASTGHSERWWTPGRFYQMRRVCAFTSRDDSRPSGRAGDDKRETREWTRETRERETREWTRETRERAGDDRECERDQRESREWHPGPAGVIPFDWPVVIENKARAAMRETDAHDLAHWLRMAWSMHPFDNARGSGQSGTFVSDEHTYAILKDRKRWREFITNGFYHSVHAIHDRPRAWMSYNQPFKTDDRTWYANASVRRALDLVRLAVYRKHGCVITQRREWLATSGEVLAYMQLRERYPWV